MQMCLYKCVPANVFIQMCLCRCVFTNMFVQMCSCKCVCKRVCTNVSSHYCIVQLSFGYCPVIVRYLPKSCIIDSCSSPSDSLISLSYSMATFSANSFGLFFMKLNFSMKLIFFVKLNFSVKLIFFVKLKFFREINSFS